MLWSDTFLKEEINVTGQSVRILFSEMHLLCLCFLYCLSVPTIRLAQRNKLSPLGAVELQHLMK